MDLSKARVLVTGGSSGIGLATARLLVDRGAQVAIAARGEARLQKAADEIEALPVRADVGNEAEVQRLMQSVVEGLGGLDVLVNNAGGGRFAPLIDVELEDFVAVVQTNLVGAMLVGREAARHFVKQGGGHIVNVGSTASRKGFAGGSAYCASKFGLQGMTECWRAELRQHDVRVMQLNPSEVQTSFGGSESEEDPTRLQANDVAEVIVSMLELDDRGFIPETTIWATNPS